MKTDKASIYIDAYELHKLLKKAQFMMTKADRIIYGTPVLQQNEKFLSTFVMAYDFPSKRKEYIEEMCACFEVLKINLRIIAEDNVIKSTNADNVNIKPDTIKIQIFQLIGRLDEGVTKWRNSVFKGQD